MYGLSTLQVSEVWAKIRISARDFRRLRRIAVAGPESIVEVCGRQVDRWTAVRVPERLPSIVQMIRLQIRRGALQRRGEIWPARGP